MHDPALLVTAPLPDGQSPTRHEITIGQGPASPPIALVGTQFCTPYFLDFSVEKKLSAKRYAITDRDGKAAFQVKGRKFTLRHKRRLFNDHGKVILTLKRKVSEFYHDGNLSIYSFGIIFTLESLNKLTFELLLLENVVGVWITIRTNYGLIWDYLKINIFYFIWKSF